MPRRRRFDDTELHTSYDRSCSDQLRRSRQSHHSEAGPSSSAQQPEAGPSSSTWQHEAGPSSFARQPESATSSSVQHSESEHDPPTDEDAPIDEIHVEGSSIYFIIMERFK